MKKNESPADRVVRFVLGAALAAGGLLTSGVLSIVLFVLAAVMVVTAIVGFCPLYALLKINTCKMAKNCS